METTELFGRYAWSYDCSDADEVAATFTPDGAIEAFGGKRPAAPGLRRL